MQAGSLDRRVLIEYKVVAQDSTYGTQGITWTTLATVWGEVLPEVGGERGDKVRIATGKYRVRIRYRSDVTTDMRVTVGGKVMQIIGLAELGRQEGLDLACEDYSTTRGAQ